MCGPLKGVNYIISIHVPRAGDDISCHLLFLSFAISIHVPRAGDD